MIRTKEGGYAYEHALDHSVEFFSKAGGLFERRESFYFNEVTALSLFQKSWAVNKPITMKLLFWLRDCRGGAGNRSAFRQCLRWLADHDPDWVIANLELVPQVGRWDDLRCLLDKNIDKRVFYAAAKLWADALKEGNVLAAKWCDRKDVAVRHQLGFNTEIRAGEAHDTLRFREEAKFRKFLARIRASHIVEHKLTQRNYSQIDYETVPSVAMARYTKAFARRDPERFNEYKEALKKGKASIHAGVLFPHDCVRTALNGDTEIADAQFEALPNYLEGTNERIIVIADTSSSMCIRVSGQIQAVHVSQGMALYCSDRIGKNNPFYRKFIAFCSESEFKSWENMTFSQAVNDKSIFDQAWGGTRIDKALLLILNVAQMFRVKPEQMPTTLLIISDMQFHEGVQGGHAGEVPKALEMWERAGYNPPKVIYWNTAGYAGQPDTALRKNIALVSGFSPAVLKSIFAGEDLSPRDVMLHAIEKYKIVVPGKEGVPSDGES